jgi:hypothetical protein
MFSQHGKTLELWLRLNGGLAYTIEPSLAKPAYGVIEISPRPGLRVTHEQKIMLLDAARKLSREVSGEAAN